MKADFSYVRWSIDHRIEGVLFRHSQVECCKAWDEDIVPLIKTSSSLRTKSKIWFELENAIQCGEKYCPT